MSDELNQMGLFGEVAEAPQAAVAVKKEPRPQRERAPKPLQVAPPKPRKKGKPQDLKMAAAPRKVSGLVPEGDVRLTANIRQDLHLKLKITSAYRRTTIGELIEELVEKYL